MGSSRPRSHSSRPSAARGGGRRPPSGRPAGSSAHGPRRGSTTLRVRIAMGLIVVLTLALAARAFQLQGLDSAANAQAAAEKMTHTRTIKATRGAILDRNGEVLASTQPAVKVIADPTAISANGYNTGGLTDEQAADLAERTPHQIAEVLVNFLGGATTDYLPALTRTTNDDGSADQYEVLEERVSADTYEQLHQALVLIGPQHPARHEHRHETGTHQQVGADLPLGELPDRPGQRQNSVEQTSAGGLSHRRDERGSRAQRGVDARIARRRGRQRPQGQDPGECLRAQSPQRQPHRLPQPAQPGGARPRSDAVHRASS